MAAAAVLAARDARKREELQAQEEARKVQKYRQTAKQQEAIIQRLEALLAAALKANGRRAPPRTWKMPHAGGRPAAPNVEESYTKDEPAETTQVRAAIPDRVAAGAAAGSTAVFVSSPPPSAVADVAVSRSAGM